MHRLRIAIAYDCLFPLATGGGERLYRLMAEDLTRRGHRVTYLTSRQWDDAAPDAVFPIVPVSPRLELYDEAGVRRSVAALRFALGLFRHLLGHRRAYDALIVSGLPVLNVYAARLALLGSRTRLSVDYLEVWGRRQWVDYAGPKVGNIAWLLQRGAVLLSPMATCHSRLTADRLRAERLRSEPVVSPGLIEPHADVVPSPSYHHPPYVLYVGRHIPDKQVDVIPAALAVARTSIPDLRAVVLGAGPSHGDVVAAIRRAGTEDHVDLPGFVGQEDLDRLFSGAAALVNPSRREGYGLVVVEAASHATPTVLVAGPDNAAIELVTPGVNGEIAVSTSPADLGAALVAAVRGGDELRAHTRAWYAEAVRTRTVEQTVSGILAALAATSRRS